jgi:RNA recognition motif-containing protein
MSATKWRNWNDTEPKEAVYLQNGRTKQQLRPPVTVMAGRGRKDLDVSTIRLPEAALPSATVSNVGVGFGRGKSFASTDESVFSSTVGDPKNAYSGTGEDKEDPNRTISLVNLPPSLSKNDLTQLLEGYGSVENVAVVEEGPLKSARIQMDSRSSCEWIISCLDNTTLDGTMSSPLQCRFTHTSL